MKQTTVYTCPRTNRTVEVNTKPDTRIIDRIAYQIFNGLVAGTLDDFMIRKETIQWKIKGK